MWPFKKKEIYNYRICYQYGKYYIERFYKNLGIWETLHFYPALNKYDWYQTPDTTYVVKLDSLKEAREKVSEVIPQYFSAKAPDPQPYGPF